MKVKLASLTLAIYQAAKVSFSTKYRVQRLILLVYEAFCCLCSYSNLSKIAFFLVNLLYYHSLIMKIVFAENICIT